MYVVKQGGLYIILSAHDSSVIRTDRLELATKFNNLFDVEAEMNIHLPPRKTYEIFGVSSIGEVMPFLKVSNGVGNTDGYAGPAEQVKFVIPEKEMDRDEDSLSYVIALWVQRQGNKAQLRAIEETISVLQKQAGKLREQNL